MNPRYEQIINLERPKSRHPKMSLDARAGQFSAFNALTGHEEAIENTARQHEEEKNIDFQIGH